MTDPSEPLLINPELDSYLNHHLAASFGAVDLIQELADRQTTATEERFFLELKAAVIADQELVKLLLALAGGDECRPQQVASNLSARASRLKLWWDGLERGELGRFEALELVATGIQGKRLFWAMLAAIAPTVPSWEGIDFAKQEKTAELQFDAIEKRRLAAGTITLTDTPLT